VVLASCKWIDTTTDKTHFSQGTGLCPRPGYLFVPRHSSSELKKSVPVLAG
jgi:hypothetical protein